VDSSHFLPLGEITCYILLSLAPGMKHGYAILKEVELLSRGALALSTSSLYDALTRLLQDGLIERVEAGSQEANSRGRKYYALSEAGRRALAAEVQRMQHILEIAQPRVEGRQP